MILSGPSSERVQCVRFVSVDLMVPSCAAAGGVGASGKAVGGAAAKKGEETAPLPTAAAGDAGATGGVGAADIGRAIEKAVAASLAPLLEAMERDKAEAKKRHAAEVERQKKLLQVLQQTLEQHIPAAVESAVAKALAGSNKQSSETAATAPASEAVASVLQSSVRQCFADMLVPRLERGVSQALLSQKGGPAAAAAAPASSAPPAGDAVAELRVLQVPSSFLVLSCFSPSHSVVLSLLPPFCSFVLSFGCRWSCAA
jgi:hypothetical protein